MCYICGQPNYVRCNCASAQPFCDQCNPNTNCTSITDSQCVIYHFASPGYIPPPTKLINLNMPNGSSAEAIFEKIDTMFGAGFFRPWITGDTNTLHLHLDGPGLPVVLKGDVKLSSSGGNELQSYDDGLFVSFNPNYKVKVDATAPPRYLADCIIGGTDGCVSITVNDIGGLLNIQPFLDIQCFTDRMCDSSGTTKAQLGACLLNSSLSVLDTPSIDLVLTPILNGLQLSANSKISATSGNVIVINSDGLYASGGTSVTANNGLTETSGNIQLGGTLIHDTTIDFSAFSLNFINSPKLLGTNTDNTNLHPFSFTVQHSLTNSSYSNVNAYTEFNNSTNFTQSQNVANFANGGQLFFSNTGNITLNSGTNLIISGIYGVAALIGSGSVTGNIIAGGQFQGAGKGSSNADSMSSVLVQGLCHIDSNPYTGTVTNYYGIYVRDIFSSDFASQITNKFGVFIAGSHSAGYNVAETAFATSSDKRVKENVVTSKYGLSDIEKLRTVEFNIISDPNKSKKIGFIAQEILEIIPEAVGEIQANGFDDFKVIEYDVIFSIMVNAIKDLSNQNKALNERISMLESKF